MRYLIDTFDRVCKGKTRGKNSCNRTNMAHNSLPFAPIILSRFNRRFWRPRKIPPKLKLPDRSGSEVDNFISNVRNIPPNCSDIPEHVPSEHSAKYSMPQQMSDCFQQNEPSFSRRKGQRKSCHFGGPIRSSTVRQSKTLIGDVTQDTGAVRTFSKDKRSFFEIRKSVKDNETAPFHNTMVNKERGRVCYIVMPSNSVQAVHEQRKLHKISEENLNDHGRSDFIHESRQYPRFSDVHSMETQNSFFHSNVL